MIKKNTELRPCDKPRINKGDLDPNQYTLSLLKKAYSLGIVEVDLLEKVNMEVLQILKELMVDFTKGESSSVAVDTGERLLTSIYYSIDAYAHSFEYPEEFLELLKYKSMKEIYFSGIGIVSQCLREAKSMFSEVLRNRLKVPLESYKLSICEDIPAFFEKYEIVFGAQDTMAGLDYPLVFDDMSVRGIYYIKNYLENLQIETMFCRCFSDEELLKALKVYGKQNGIEYTSVPLNLFQIIICGSMFSVLSGDKGSNTVISRARFEVLKNRLYSIKPTDINKLVDDTLVSMLEELVIKDSKVIDYIKRYAELFKKSLLDALENDSLKNIVLIEDSLKPSETGTIFKSGEKMTSIEFKALVKKIEKCNSIEEMALLIVNSLNSIHDFIDILEGDILYGEEYNVVFGYLGDLELSAMGLAIFYDELRDRDLDIDDINNLYFEEEWKCKYLEYIKALEEKRKKSILAYINETRLEQEQDFDHRLR